MAKFSCLQVIHIDIIETSVNDVMSSFVISDVEILCCADLNDEQEIELLPDTWLHSEAVCQWHGYGDSERFAKAIIHLLGIN